MCSRGSYKYLRATKQSGWRKWQWSVNTLYIYTTIWPDLYCTNENSPLITNEQLPTLAEIATTLLLLRDCDVQENKKIVAFAQDGCKCLFGPGGRYCCTLFAKEHYKAIQCCCLELSKDQKDCVMKGQILAMTNTSQFTLHTTAYQHRNQERRREHMTYSHRGVNCVL